MIQAVIAWPDDPRSWIILGLLTLELMTFLVIILLSHKLSLRRGVLKRFVKLLRIDIRDLFLWLIFIGVSVWAGYSVQDIRIPLTVTLSGVLLFTLGFLARYWSWLWRLVWTIRYFRLLFSHVPGADDLLASRHPERLGLMFEGLGLMTISEHWSLLLAGGIGLLSVGVVSMRSADMRQFPADYKAWLDERGTRLYPDWKRITLLCLGVIIITGVVSLLVRERVLFVGNQESARVMLRTLAQVQATFGVLPITIGFVLVSIASSAVSVRASGYLIRRPIVLLTVTVLVVSISLDVLLLARADDLFSSDRSANSVWVDLGILMAGMTITSVFFFVWRAHRLMSPETLVREALKRFDRGWVRTIKQDWREPRFSLTLRVSDNPMVVIERLLASSIERGDNISFATALGLLVDRVHEVVRPSDIIEVDSYFHYYLQGVVRLATQKQDYHALLAILQLIDEIGEADAEQKKKSMNHFEPPGGERLLRYVLEQSIETKVSEVAARAVQLVAQRGVSFLKQLPQAQDTYMFDPNIDALKGQMPQEHYDKRMDNDRMVTAFQDNYLQYLGEIGCDGNRNNLPYVGWAATYDMTWLLSTALSELQDTTIRGSILRWGLSDLNRVSNCISTLEVHGGFRISMLEYAVENLRADSENRMAEDVVYYLGEILSEQSNAGVLEYGTVVDVALVGLRLAPKFPEAECKLIDAMGVAASHIKNLSRFGMDRDLQFVYDELISRIRQQGMDRTTSSWEVIREKIREALAILGEPEVEARRRAWPASNLPHRVTATELADHTR